MCLEGSSTSSEVYYSTSVPSASKEIDSSGAIDFSASSDTSLSD